jgi:hypothetical protein
LDPEGTGDPRFVGLGLFKITDSPLFFKPKLTRAESVYPPITIESPITDELVTYEVPPVAVWTKEEGSNVLANCSSE